MTRGLVLAVVAVAFAVVLGMGTPITEDILGTWINIDPETQGLAQIAVLPSEAGGLNAFGYGVCTPSYCEWGATPLVLVGMPPSYVEEWGIAIWDLDSLRTVLTFHLEGEFLVAELFTYLTDGTGTAMREVILLRKVY